MSALHGNNQGGSAVQESHVPREALLVAPEKREGTAGQEIRDRQRGAGTVHRETNQEEREDRGLHRGEAKSGAG